MGGDVAALRSLAGTEGDGDRDPLASNVGGKSGGWGRKVSVRMCASILADNPIGTNGNNLEYVAECVDEEEGPSAPAVSGDPYCGGCRPTQDT